MRRTRLWTFVTGLAAACLVTSIPVLTAPFGRAVGADTAVAAPPPPYVPPYVETPEQQKARLEAERLRREEEKRRREEEQRRLQEEERARIEQQRREQAENAFRGALEQARKAIDANDLDKAQSLADKAETQARRLGEPQMADVKTLREDLNAAAARLLEAANDDYAAGKFAQAIKQYRIIATLHGLDAAKQAAEKLRAAQKDPAVRAAMREADAEKAYSVVVMAIQGERKKLTGPEAKPKEDKPEAEAPNPPSDLEIITRMSISKKAEIVRGLMSLKQSYGDTESGKKGVELLGQLESDPKLLEEIKKWQGAEKARQAFDLAQTYEKAKMVEKAVECYTKLIEEYPQSEYAAQAEERLAKIKQES